MVLYYEYHFKVIYMLMFLAKESNEKSLNIILVLLQFVPLNRLKESLKNNNFRYLSF